MGITRRPFRIVWRPNNYRRQTAIREVSDSGVRDVITHYQKADIGQASVTKKKVIYVRLPGVTLQVGRTNLTAIWAQPIIDGVKEHVLIERDTMEEMENALMSRVEEIRVQLDEAIESFVETFQLRAAGASIVWSRYEDFIKGDEYIDQLPQGVIIHDTVFKKVYNEGIEFKQSDREPPGVRIKNYVKNRALEDLSPEIAEELRELRLEIRPSERVMQLVRSLDDFNRRDVRELVMVLSLKERERLTTWVFTKFGSGPSVSSWMRIGVYVRWRCGACGSSNIPGRSRCHCGVGNRPSSEVDV